MGAVSTFAALIIIILAKFMEGAWIVIVTAPILFWIAVSINKHYKRVFKQLEKPLDLEYQKSCLKDPIMIVPISGWNTAAESSLRFAVLLSEEVIAVYIDVEGEEEKLKLKSMWKERIQLPAKKALERCPKLKIIKPSYIRIFGPIMSYLRKVRKKHPHRLIAVVIPEIVEPHWYEIVLHTLHAAGLRAALFMERDRKTIVMTVPWYIR